MKDDSMRRDHAGQVGPGSPLSFERWLDAYRALREHAEAMGAILNGLARDISADAGLDPGLLGIHPHNAMVSHDAGAPWAGVDYNRVQVVLDLLRHQFDAYRMIDAFDLAVRLDPHSRWLRQPDSEPAGPAAEQAA
jgi:hypothetical protein